MRSPAQPPLFWRWFSVLTLERDPYHSMPSPSDNSLSILGETAYHGRRRRFGINQADRLGHVWILGKTGTGKSTLLKNLIAQDLEAGRGLMLIDPHGDLVEEVLNLVPSARVRDTVYFNPADTAYPIGFNPLDQTAGLQPALVVTGIISVLRKTWPEFWGPRMEYVLRSCLMTLLKVPGATLLDLHRLLVDAEFRKRIIPRVNDPQLRQFWEKEFALYGTTFRTEAVSPIVNKTGQYLTMPLLRNIIGQPKSAFSLRRLMDEGAVCLANLARGRLGEDAAALLGSLLVSQLELAALGRADTDEAERPDFFLYVDEAHLVATRTMVDLFPEARKYHLGVVLAHQYLDQLGEELRYAVLGNTGTVIVFRLGARDAALLANEFSPEFEPTDLVGFSAHHVCLKLMVEGTTSRPFSAVTLPGMPAADSHRDHIIAESRRRFGRAVAEVEGEIMRRWHGDPISPQQRLAI